MKEPNVLAMEAVADPARLDDAEFVDAMVTVLERDVLDRPGTPAAPHAGAGARRRELDDMRITYRQAVRSAMYDEAYLATSHLRLQRELRDGIDDGNIDEVLNRLYIRAAQLGR